MLGMSIELMKKVLDYLFSKSIIYIILIIAAIVLLNAPMSLFGVSATIDVNDTDAPIIENKISGINLIKKDFIFLFEHKEEISNVISYGGKRFDNKFHWWGNNYIINICTTSGCNDYKDIYDFEVIINPVFKGYATKKVNMTVRDYIFSFF